MKGISALDEEKHQEQHTISAKVLSQRKQDPEVTSKWQSTKEVRALVTLPSVVGRWANTTLNMNQIPAMNTTQGESLGKLWLGLL